jgi:hypothetical protein
MQIYFQSCYCNIGLENIEHFLKLRPLRICLRIVARHLQNLQHDRVERTCMHMKSALVGVCEIERVNSWQTRALRE